MGFSLKDIFKKKEGGTGVGNALRSLGTGLASKVLGDKGADSLMNALNPVPAARAKVQQEAVKLVVAAQASPMKSFTDADAVAREASNKILAAGGSTSEASSVSQSVLQAAQLPAAVNSLSEQTKKDGVAILRGGLKGMAVEFLNTKPGQEIEKAGISAFIDKYLPVMGLALCGIGLFFAAKKK